MQQFTSLTWNDVFLLRYNSGQLNPARDIMCWFAQWKAYAAKITDHPGHGTLLWHSNLSNKWASQGIFSFYSLLVHINDIRIYVINIISLTVTEHEILITMLYLPSYTQIFYMIGQTLNCESWALAIDSLWIRIIK